MFIVWVPVMFICAIIIFTVHIRFTKQDAESIKMKGKRHPYIALYSLLCIAGFCIVVIGVMLLTFPDIPTEENCGDYPDSGYIASQRRR